VTAVAVSPRTARFRPARALRLEIKHSPVVWALPVLAAVFYFDAYRTAAGFPPVWTVRASVVSGPNLVFFSVIGAGIAAWAAAREGRRRTGDLLATTARAPWARRLTVLAATTFWVELAYLAGVAVIYIQTATLATWGGPPLWPVAVGAAGVAAGCAIGFSAGAFFPSRFTAPIVAVAVFVAWFVGVAAANGVQDAANGMRGTSALLVAVTGRPQDPGLGVFYRVAPDISIAQVMVMGGVLLAAVGLLVRWPAPPMPAGRRLTVAAAVLVGCGVAAAATAFSLAGTARNYFPTGWDIPALHDAADDQPVPYAPDCAGTAFTVCIHPAFASYLGAMSAALQPAAAEIAGLPGAPVRAEMNAGVATQAVAGTTSVYTFSTQQEGFGDESFWASPAEARTADWEQGAQQDFITWFLSDPAEPNWSGPTPAEEAVAIALLARIGAPVPQYPQFSQPSLQSGGSSTSTASGTTGTSGSQSGATAGQITAAAVQFESLSSDAQHAWLAANVAALRSGAITLAQLP
jgi:hypothetical protein